MKRKKMLIFILCVVVVILAYLVKLLYFPVIYPTKSSPRELSLVKYGGFNTEKQVITLRHTTGDHHSAKYTLTIENGIRIQEPQFYQLPKLDDGTIEVDLEFIGVEAASFTMVYNKASDFYENGLLIYLDTDFNSQFIWDKDNYVYHDRYVHFISGDNRVCYFKKAGSSEWTIVTSSPRLRMIPRYEQPYLVWDSKWRDNKWVEEVLVK